jgi:hypothetical protein
MTTARPWPNNTAWARDCAAEDAITGIRALRPLVEGGAFTREEVLRRQAIALGCFYDIAQALARAGAQVQTIT